MESVPNPLAFSHVSAWKAIGRTLCPSQSWRLIRLVTASLARRATTCAFQLVPGATSAVHDCPVTSCYMAFCLTALLAKANRERSRNMFSTFEKPFVPFLCICRYSVNVKMPIGSDKSAAIATSTNLFSSS